MREGEREREKERERERDKWPPDAMFNHKNHKSHTDAAYLEELKTRCCCFGRQSDDMRGTCLYMIGLILLFNNKLLRITPIF